MRGRILILLSFLSCVFISCDREELSSEISSQSGETALFALNLELPTFEKFDEVTNYNSVVATFVGVGDHVEYLVPMSVESDGEQITLRSISADDLSEMPLQRYYFNYVTYGDQTKSGDLQSSSLGAILSVEDPDNIYYVSSFDTRSERVGSGSESDPYTITSVKDLAEDMLYNMAEATYFGEEEVYEGVYFLQTDNIDLSIYDDAMTFTGSWTPLGAPIAILNGDGVAFRGVYDGGGFFIHNLNSDVQSSLGFFYKLGDGAVVKNLEFVGVSLSGGEAVAVVAAYSEGSVTIEDVSLSGHIRATLYLGGFIARCDDLDGSTNSLKFSGCNNYLSMSFNYNAYLDIAANGYYVTEAGGFIGYTNVPNCDFEYCNYNAVIAGDCVDNVGGFVGGLSSLTAQYNFKYCGVAGVLGGNIGDLGGFIGAVHSASLTEVSDCRITFDAAKVGGIYLQDNYGEYQYTESECVLYQNNFDNSSYLGGFIGIVDMSRGGGNTVVIDMTSSSPDSYGNCAISYRTTFKRILEGVDTYHTCRMAGIVGCFACCYGDGIKAGSVVDLAATFDLDGYYDHTSMLFYKLSYVGAYMTVNILEGCSGYESMSAMVVDGCDSMGDYESYYESDIQINNYLGSSAKFPTYIGDDASDVFKSSYVTVTNK